MDKGGKDIDKKPLIGVSIVAVVLLILGSLTNVVGYQAVQSSNQNAINSEVNQKELLFQTILDIANNREIQRVIFNSEMREKGFFSPSIGFSLITPQVLTKNHLKQMYLVGLMLSKIISKLQIRSMVEQDQLNNQLVLKEITDVIEKDATIKRDITQLSNLKCNCENENIVLWHFPVLCLLMLPIFLALYFICSLWGVTWIFLVAFARWEQIGLVLHCFWTGIPVP